MNALSSWLFIFSLAAQQYIPFRSIKHDNCYGPKHVRNAITEVFLFGTYLMSLNLRFVLKAAQLLNHMCLEGWIIRTENVLLMIPLNRTNLKLFHDPKRVLSIFNYMHCYLSHKGCKAQDICYDIINVGLNTLLVSG